MRRAIPFIICPQGEAFCRCVTVCYRLLQIAVTSVTKKINSINHIFYYLLQMLQIIRKFIENILKGRRNPCGKIVKAKISQQKFFKNPKICNICNKFQKKRRCILILEKKIGNKSVTKSPDL